MQFIKKNYEKILLGLVLLGLVVVAVFLMFLVSSEKEEQAKLRETIIQRTPKPLAEPDVSRVEVLLRRVQAPFVLVFSDPSNKLFNPERWQRRPDGVIFENPTGTELDKLEAIKPSPLYLVFTLDSVNTSDTGVRYQLGVEQQAAVNPRMRGKRPYYVTKSEKKDYGERKDSFTIVDVQGTPESPVLTLELSDSPEKVTLSKEKPFRRVDGQMADLSYPPEKKLFPNRREGSTIFVAGEDYTIVRVLESEVILQGNNKKKWSKKFNTSP